LTDETRISRILDDGTRISRILGGRGADQPIVCKPDADYAEFHGPRFNEIAPVATDPHESASRSNESEDPRNPRLNKIRVIRVSKKSA